MSKTKLMSEELIRKAKYRVKNAEGQYELVYLETSADQVEETADRVFVSPEEKTQITTNKDAITQEVADRKAADKLLADRLDVIEGEEIVEGSVKKALKDAKSYTDTQIGLVNSDNEALKGRVSTLETSMAEVDGKIDAAKTEAISDAKTETTRQVTEAKEALEGTISTLEGRVSTNENDIRDLKSTVSNKNNNTVVVNTEAEIASANTNPKKGDLAYVISSKRAYIYNGLSTLSVVGLPEGWVVFDEITSEVDLVKYLKIEDAAATYRRLDTKIVEADLDNALSTKINGKADLTHVTSEIDKVTKAVEAEVTARTEGDSALDGKITTVSESVTALESKVNEQKTEINNKIDKNVTAVSAEQPMDTATGHVWLEILG